MALGGIRVTQAMSEKDVALMSGRSGSKQEGIGEWEEGDGRGQGASLVRAGRAA